MATSIQNHSHDFIAGSIAGCTCKLLEFPFDTIKVLQQTSVNGTPNIGIYRCLKNVMQNNGVRGLYNGLFTPLLSCTFETAVLFYVFEKSKNLLANSSSSPSTGTILTAGALAGICTSILVTPVEFIKCNLQVQSHSAVQKKFTGPLDCTIQTIKEKGLRGMYKGYFATMLREGPGSSLWFLSYEWSSKVMLKEGQTKDDLPLWKLMCSGAFSGIAYWAAFFPADVIKSKLQTSMTSNQSFWHLFLKIKRTEGLRGLYRGFMITAIKAIPANAILFMSYEACKRVLQSV